MRFPRQSQGRRPLSPTFLLVGVLLSGALAGCTGTDPPPAGVPDEELDTPIPTPAERVAEVRPEARVARLGSGAFEAFEDHHAMFGFDEYDNVVTEAAAPFTDYFDTVHLYPLTAVAPAGVPVEITARIDYAASGAHLMGRFVGDAAVRWTSTVMDEPGVSLLRLATVLRADHEGFTFEVTYSGGDMDTVHYDLNLTARELTDELPGATPVAVALAARDMVTVVPLDDAAPPTALFVRGPDGQARQATHDNTTGTWTWQADVAGRYAFHVAPGQVRVGVGIETAATAPVLEPIARTVQEIEGTTHNEEVDWSIQLEQTPIRAGIRLAGDGVTAPVAHVWIWSEEGDVFVEQMDDAVFVAPTIERWGAPAHPLLDTATLHFHGHVGNHAGTVIEGTSLITTYAWPET